MGYQILIAESCEFIRLGLQKAFLDDQRVSRVFEATTGTSLKVQMHCRRPDLVVVNQSLITDITIFPKGKFVILASKPDLSILQAAYKHGMRGYLSEQASVDLLKLILDSSGEALVLDPGLTPWIMEHLFGGAFASIREDLLTRREREVLGLLKNGCDRQTIARHLSISEATLKTHIKNMRKHEVKLRAIQTMV